ncbi:MAG: alpha-E domain-containing protein [Aestuariivita sp.]|nr:alpha-E domain-containing protein [Aestuariivita sp.]MCY4203459.1 alpha-E domain-containing protein [Aestuariivita sp.]MCY4288500.1 alpha-E domain-containing protein [Aestuariivita sp.]MCY4347084.1 alpha-E domain-containing protein [Aestuariivita sp.]
MLGRTANGLYWMYRYLERAENTARLIATGQRIALTRLHGGDDEWRSILQTAAVLEGYDQRHSELTKASAINWLLRSEDNPSSIYACLMAARQNARMVRTALTGEVWEAVNATYMHCKATLKRRLPERDIPTALASIRQRTALVRGMTHGTMLRNEIFDFARIGTFLERADNTARILDVKYYVLLPSVTAVGSSIDNVQWETILRSVSARGGFMMEYGNSFSASDIANFLLLDNRMPRSLAFCTSKISDNLHYLTANYPISPPSCEQIESIQQTHLRNHISEIFESGLHEFLQEYIALLGALGRQIEIDFRFYE